MADPAQYGGSGNPAKTLGEPDAPPTPHTLYLALGADAEAGQKGHSLPALPHAQPHTHPYRRFAAAHSDAGDRREAATSRDRRRSVVFFRLPDAERGRVQVADPGTRAERALNGRMNEIAAVARIDNDRIVPVDGWPQLPERGDARLRRAAAAIYPRTTCPRRRAVRYTDA